MQGLCSDVVSSPSTQQLSWITGKETWDGYLLLEDRGQGKRLGNSKRSLCSGTGTAVTVFVFETGRSQGHYVTEDNLEFLTFLPPTSKCEVCITTPILHRTREQTPGLIHHPTSVGHACLQGVCPQAFQH